MSSASVGPKFITFAAAVTTNDGCCSGTDVSLVDKVRSSWAIVTSPSLAPPSLVSRAISLMTRSASNAVALPSPFWS